MYTTTFYSFKGGVGRSMALANVAVELTNRGRRVLAVDFDLEAPGLDTFDVLRPKDSVPGIIDFVRAYLDSNRAPDASRYMSKLPDVGDGGGELWIMPSGAQDAEYAAHYNEIDWADLYERHDGYLLFEDLKAQWQQIANPDYVLVDSRTGHTDTGGICTRQLPDAVAILFFPNEQNLRGLIKVVGDIRAERKTPQRRAVELHFVMSNVPDLDDEDKILEEKIEAFRRELEFEREPLMVHRYDSLSLLNQVVFTRDRPKSRLAREYRGIVREIVGHNLADRDGALEYLARTRQLWRRSRMAYESPKELRDRLGSIEQIHSKDGEVLFALGEFRERDPRVERVASLFDRAIEAGYREPEVYLQRARVRARDKDLGGAGEDALRVLQGDRVAPPIVWEAVSLARPDRSEEVARSPALASLDVEDRVSLAGGLEEWPTGIRVAVSILEPIVGGTEVAGEERRHAQGILAMRYLALGRCTEAVGLLTDGGLQVDDMNIQEAFNYGMARWGSTGDLVATPFLRVVELDREDRRRDGPNYLQCMAVAYWAAGEGQAAGEFREAAGAAVRGSEFSSWRYYVVVAEEFKRDLEDLQSLMEGEMGRVPRFMVVRGRSGGLGQ